MRKISSAAAAFGVAATLSILSCHSGQARPFRGGIPWSILLCKFSDSPAPPHDASYYQDLFLNGGKKGLNDYVGAISNHQADLGGSSVHGWYTEAHTTAVEAAVSDRWKRVQDCIDTAAASTTDRYVPPAGQRVYVITSPGQDLGGWENRGAIGQDNTALPEIAHEFGHGVGLNHSWSDDVTWKDIDWAGGGEYDNPWDLMSAANVYVDPTGAFGGGPPSLDAHHLDELGWIPKSRTLTLGVDGILSRTVTLAALNHPDASGFYLVRIPFDAKDPFHYYTVEYRRPDGWDAGIPAAVVMINEVKSNGSYYQTTLLRELGSKAGSGDGAPVQSVDANGVTISVQGTSGNQATIAVKTALALGCAEGFVWREASPIDRVCVVPATRTQAASDNAQAGSRHVPNGNDCLQGFVWREAYPGDAVCVPPAIRAQARADDAAAYAHVDETIVSYGPNTCRKGFVWRDGDDSDFVCVSPATRTQAAADNAAAGQHHVAGSDVCVQGFVWREAWAGDHVCVGPATRSQAKADNDQAAARLAQQFADAQAPQGSSFASLLGITAAHASELDEAETPPPVSEPVLRTRLAKMGYTQVPKLERKGDTWEATVVKGGNTRVLHFHAPGGRMIEGEP